MTTPSHHTLNDVNEYFNDVTSHFSDVPLSLYLVYRINLVKYGILIRRVWAAHGHLHAFVPKMCMYKINTQMILIAYRYSKDHT